MRRSSIARLMVVTAILGVNLALVRLFWERPIANVPGPYLLFSLIPLVEAFLLALWVVVRRHAIDSGSREMGKRVGFAGGFAVATGLLLLGVTPVFVLFPDGVASYIEGVWSPLDPVFESWDVSTYSQSRLIRLAVIPVLLWIPVCLPLGLLAVALAFPIRFGLVAFSRRKEVPCDDSASAA